MQEKVCARCLAPEKKRLAGAEEGWVELRCGDVKKGGNSSALQLSSSAVTVYQKWSSPAILFPAKPCSSIPRKGQGKLTAKSSDKSNGKKVREKRLFLQLHMLMVVQLGREHDMARCVDQAAPVQISSPSAAKKTLNKKIHRRPK